jgi:S1-C subfamily serine protease
MIRQLIYVLTVGVVRSNHLDWINIMARGKMVTLLSLLLLVVFVSSCRTVNRSNKVVRTLPSDMREHELCLHATHGDNGWAKWDLRIPVYFELASRQGLSLEKCAMLMGLKYKVSDELVESVKKRKNAEAEQRRNQLAQDARNRKAEAERRRKEKIESNRTPETGSSTSGSGFFISRLGHLITNQHVVNECRSVTVGDNGKKQVSANVIETDGRNDLALLRISSTELASAETKSLIRKLGIRIAKQGVPLSSDGLLRSEDVELGEKVMVSGYPYGEIFSDTIKVTSGIVSAVRGMGDDSGQFQIDAAVQPGNSGGPIYDENGNIVGVVVAQLNKLKVAKAIGSLPENVNFGIKASTVRQFLTSAGLPTKWSERSRPMSTRDLAKIAKNQTLMVVCHR